MYTSCYALWNFKKPILNLYLYTVLLSRLKFACLLLKLIRNAFQVYCPFQAKNLNLLAHGTLWILIIISTPRIFYIISISYVASF